MILSSRELERLFNKIKISPSCWVWMGATKNSDKNRSGGGKYGVLTIKYKNYQAHRIIYVLFKGEILKGLEIDHLCRNTLCVNPEHLEAVTHSENMKRGTAHYRVVEINTKKTHCPKGHEYNKENTYRPKGSLNERHCRECNRIKSREYQSRLRKAIQNAERE